MTLDELDDLLDAALSLDCDPSESSVCYDQHYDLWSDYRFAIDQAYDEGLDLTERHLNLL